MDIFENIGQYLTLFYNIITLIWVSGNSQLNNTGQLPGSRNISCLNLNIMLLGIVLEIWIIKGEGNCLEMTQWELLTNLVFRRLKVQLGNCMDNLGMRIPHRTQDQIENKCQGQTLNLWEGCCCCCCCCFIAVLVFKSKAKS